MAFLQYSLGKITAWSGDPLVPTVDAEDDTVFFDNLRLPLVYAESGVEAVESSGRDYHGLRVREKRSQVITATATLFCVNIAAGFAVRDLLRSWKPVAGETSLGVWAVYAGVGGGPYDLLAADLARSFQFVLNPVGTIVPSATVRFDYAIQLKERARPTEATP